MGAPDTLIRRFELTLGDLGEGVRKWDFALAHMISGGVILGSGIKETRLGGERTRRRPKL